MAPPVGWERMSIFAALEGHSRFRGAAEEDGFELVAAFGGVHEKFKNGVPVAADSGSARYNGFVASGRSQQLRAVFQGASARAMMQLGVISDWPIMAKSL